MWKSVSASYETDPLRDSPPEERSLPGLGESLQIVAPHFDEEGALGLLLVDASAFISIERSYGSAALEQTLRKLGALVQRAVENRLGINDQVLAGEIGRSEILVVLSRPQDESRFYVEELPALRQAIAVALGRQASRLAYPYLRDAPPVYMGVSATLRNPAFSVETQVRNAIEEARRDAELESRITRRERRRRFMEMLLNGDVYSVYEPIVEVKSKTVFGYEALARGPVGTPLHSAPAMFAAAGEEGLLYDLDCLCRRRGLEGAMELPSGTKLFLNIRPTSIHDPNFRAEALSRTLEHSPFEPGDVVFEISEQESIANFDMFREARDYYRNLGFQIAIDDMGAGYGSLEAVMELEPDYIKVDRTCVSRVDKDPARHVLLLALHAVSEGIGASIIAEGLDTL